MKDVVIVGAGGLGREVREWIDDINEVAPTFRLVGFVDDDPTKQRTRIRDVPVLGTLEWLLRARGTSVVVAIGDPSAKRKVVAQLPHHDFPPIVHPRAVVGTFVEIGAGSIVCPGVVITTDVRIGRFVALNFNLTVGHDALIGDYALLAPGVHLSGFARVGEGCNLGAGAVILPSVSVGEWSVIGSGAVVVAELPANCTAVGVPAKVIKTRSPGWHLA